ncbi:MAG: TIGR04190 family B12-binding domain/radical SAM domain protein [Chloroflexota bacterium]
MPRTDLILLHAPSVYDFRQKTILYGPVSDQIPSSPVFEMYPIGFASIADYLERAGYRVRIVNLALRMLNDRKFSAEKMLEKLEAPVFGIDLHWMVHCHGSIEVARLVKKHHPQAKVIFGGLSASYFYQELMEFPEIDYVMRGDSTEEPLRQLMECVKGKKEPEAVPNLAWRDRQGIVRENSCSQVPTDLSHVMKDHYGNAVRSVIRYRDFAGYTPFRGWADYPITAVLTCRGCTQNCVICGASASAFRNCYFRSAPAFRPPEAVANDLKQIERFSNGPAFILGDLRQAGDAYAADLFRRIQQKPVKNQLIFELFSPAPREFLRQMSLCSPNFCLEISPESHDPAIRKLAGRPYSSEDFEQMVADALDVGCGRLDVFYMIGIPGQTPQSVMDNVDYCGHLLEKFKGDKRLYLFIAPLSPFLDPGSLAFEQPERHGYHIFFRTLAEHRQALLQPSWKYALNYETNWMTREAIIDTSYQAMMRLNQLKAKYGIISQEQADSENERLKSGQEMVRVIDDLQAKGNLEKLQTLKEKIDRINMSPATHWSELKLPVGRNKLKMLRSLVYYALGRL